jgi:8-amino-7-oxononanoate synthase
VHLIAQFRRGAAARGIPLLPSATPIQPVRIGSSPRALAVSRRLEASGFYVPAIRPPTVPKGQARLRVTLSAAHTEREIEALLTALEAALEPTRKEESGDGG